jgi:hypothetical protein
MMRPNLRFNILEVTEPKIENLQDCVHLLTELCIEVHGDTLFLNVIKEMGMGMSLWEVKVLVRARKSTVGLVSMTMRGMHQTANDFKPDKPFATYQNASILLFQQRVSLRCGSAATRTCQVPGSFSSVEGEDILSAPKVSHYRGRRCYALQKPAPVRKRTWCKLMAKCLIKSPYFGEIFIFPAIRKLSKFG